MTEERFTFFWRGPFSQWCPCEFMVDGTTYNCAEQFMMAGKARLFEGSELYERDSEGCILLLSGNPVLTTLGKIMATAEPREQKSLGRDVTGFDPDKWDAVARNIVYQGNMAKFMQNPEFRHYLLLTDGTTLVEASPYDCIWGIGFSEDHRKAQSRQFWRGTNWLGQVLTKVREDIVTEVTELPAEYQWDK